MPREMSDVAQNNPLFMEDATSSQIRLPDGSYVDMVGTTMSKWAADFNNTGSDLDLSKWDIARQTNMTLSTAGGLLNITTGVVPNAELLLLGDVVATIPANLSIVMQRSNTTIAAANNYLRFGYLEVDPVTLLPVPHATLPGDFRNRVAFGQGRAAAVDTVANWFLEAIANNGSIRQLATASLSSSATLIDTSLEVRPDDVHFTNRGADGTGSLSGSGLRLSTVVPDPNKLYRPFVWVLNGPAPAAGSSIVLTIWRMLSMDIQEMQAEIGGGRGNAVASQSLPVTIAGGAVTVGNATASASNNNGALAIGIAAATTNVRTLKASAGKIVGGHLANFTGTWKFLKLYNKATAPIPGTDTPVYTIPIPPNAEVQIGAIFDQYGLYFGAGIGMAITGAVADLDTTVTAVGDVQYGLIYS